MQLPPELSVREQEIIKQHQVGSNNPCCSIYEIICLFTSVNIRIRYCSPNPNPNPVPAVRLQEAERRRLAAEAKIVAERRIKVGYCRT